MSNRAVFIDRDGTLIEHYDYLTEPGQVKLLSTAGSALRLLRDRGFTLVIVSNQSAIARGMLTEKKLEEIHSYLKSLLNEQGAYLDRIYYCPYHPEAVVGKYRRESDMRKPQPGMFYEAAKDLDIDLKQSWMVGDDDRDIAAGRAAGCRTILVEQRGSSLVQRGSEKPEFKVMNLQEAANIIVRQADQNEEEKIEADTRQTEIKNVEESGQEKAEGYEIKPEINNAEKQFEESSEEHTHQTQSESLPVITKQIFAPQHREELSMVRQEPSQTSKDDKVEMEKEDIEEVKRAPEVRKTTPLPVEEAKPKSETGTMEGLLRQILRELKSLHHERMEPEFSVFKLMAGVVQMMVVLCLVLAFWFNSGREPNNNSVQNCLLTAVVLQGMALTFLTISKS